MGSQNWKNHEKAVAKFFKGTRLDRYNYGNSQPDVIVEALTAKETVGINARVIIECKYSINQTWHKKIFDILNESKAPTIVRCREYLFWDMEDTAVLMNELQGKAFFYLMYHGFVTIDDKPSKKIEEAMLQALEYRKEFILDSENWLPLVCLGQKSSKKRIIYTRCSDLAYAFIDEGKLKLAGDPQSAPAPVK